MQDFLDRRLPPGPSVQRAFPAQGPDRYPDSANGLKGVVIAQVTPLPLLRHVQRPDGKGWLLQEVTTRLPGRIDAADTAVAFTADLASALRRAEAAHAEHEKRTGQRDADWPAWYAAYMMAEHAGKQAAGMNSGYDIIVISGVIDRRM